MESKDRFPHTWHCLVRLFLLLCGLEITNAQLACGKGWTHVPSQNTCLWFSNLAVRKSWQDARDACKELGGDLVKIPTSGFNKAIVDLWNYDPNNYWIGLHDPDKDGGFKWLDETQNATFTYWRKGQPDNWKKLEYCVHLSYFNGSSWADGPCEEEKRFVCQAQKGSDISIPEGPESANPDMCEDGWIPVPSQQTCLRFSKRIEKETWQGARDACRLLGSHLIKISNSDLNSAVVELWHGDPDDYWIGLHCLTGKDKFTWLNETEQTEFTYWRKDQRPDNWKNAEDCVHMSEFQEAGWNDAFCNISKRYVCQKQSIASSSSNTVGIVVGVCVAVIFLAGVSVFLYIYFRQPFDIRELWKAKSKEPVSMENLRASDINKLEDATYDNK